VVGAERAATGRGPNVKLTSVDLADGVVLHQGGYQSAAVRQRDGIVIIEAPESNAESRAVPADVATRWPGTRVKAVINTSPMWMHAGGLREYAARGIPIYVTDVGTPVVPDAFEPVFSGAYRAELARLVKREGLDVERVFSEHLPATPRADLTR
jgi:hypothetical protein